MRRVGWILLAAIPWLAFIPWGAPVAQVALNALALLAAFHGLGRGLALATRATVGPVLAAVWGVALAVAAIGVLAALHLATGDVVRVLVLCGLALHSAVAIHGALRARAVPDVEPLRVAPIIALVGIGGVLVLGLAGDPAQRVFDDETNHVAQVARLHATGALDDGLGLPRHSQLGGQIALESLWASIDSVEHLPALDGGICYVLALALVLARLGLRSRSSALWGLLLVVMTSATTFGPLADPSARWSAIALLVGLFITLEESEETAHPIPLALLAGSLATLRHELVPIAVVVIAAWWLPRRSTRDGWWCGVVALAAVAPYVIVMMTAELATAGSPRESWLVRIALFGLFAIPVGVVLGMLERPHRTIAIASVAGLAGIASELAGDRPYATRFIWPILIALLLYVAIVNGRRAAMSALAYVAALVACFLIVQARDTTGRARWSRRWSSAISGIRWLHQERVESGAKERYARLLAHAAPRRRVVAWVTEPERLPWRDELHDLRIPMVAQLRVPPWAARIAPFLDALEADYLLLEPDRPRACGTLCDDELATIARERRVVAREGGALLVELRAPR